MKIVMPYEVYKRMKIYVNAVEGEISGIGKVRVKDGIFTIEEIVILKQVCSTGNTVLDKKALGQFFSDLRKKGDDGTAWRLWWHSHGSMNTFWSQTDEEAITDYDNLSPLHNWVLSVESNHKGDFLTRLDNFFPFRSTQKDIPFEVDYSDPDLELELWAEVEEKVTDVKVVDTKKEKDPQKILENLEREKKYSNYDYDYGNSGYDDFDIYDANEFAKRDAQKAKDEEDKDLWEKEVDEGFEELDKKSAKELKKIFKRWGYPDGQIGHMVKFVKSGAYKNSNWK